MNKKIIAIITGSFFLLVILVVFLFSRKSSSLFLFPFSPTPTPISGSQTLPKVNTKSPISVTAVDPAGGTENIPLDQVIHITFSRPIDPSEIVFTINPPFRLSSSIVDNILTITPQEKLQQNTKYIYFLSFQSFLPSQSYSFTTISPDASVPPIIGDVVPQQQNQKNKITDPDVFLSNYTPYVTNAFSIDSALTPFPTDHFFFNVTLNKNNPSARRDFINWLHSLTLTDDLINKLDIRYL